MTTRAKSVLRLRPRLRHGHIVTQIDLRYGRPPGEKIESGLRVEDEFMRPLRYLGAPGRRLMDQPWAGTAG